MQLRPGGLPRSSAHLGSSQPREPGQMPRPTPGHMACGVCSGVRASHEGLWLHCLASPGSSWARPHLCCRGTGTSSSSTRQEDGQSPMHSGWAERGHWGFWSPAGQGVGSTLVGFGARPLCPLLLCRTLLVSSVSHGLSTVPGPMWPLAGSWCWSDPAAHFSVSLLLPEVIATSEAMGAKTTH